MVTCAALVVVGASDDADTVVGAPEVETAAVVVAVNAVELPGGTVVGAALVGVAVGVLGDGATVVDSP